MHTVNYQHKYITSLEFIVLSNLNRAVRLIYLTGFDVIIVLCLITL